MLSVSCALTPAVPVGMPTPGWDPCTANVPVPGFLSTQVTLVPRVSEHCKVHDWVEPPVLARGLSPSVG